MADTAVRNKQEQITWEIERRQRLAVPTMAAGVLYLLSGITATAVLRNLPTVSIVDGLRPVLTGMPIPKVSPRTPEIRFISHNAFGLIASSGVMLGLSVALLALALTFVYDATRARRPETVSAARPLVLYGGLVLALAAIVHAVTLAITTHNFVTGHDFSNAAADRALTTGTLLAIGEYVNLIATLAFGIGVALVAYNAQRVGLLPRMMGFLGIACGVLLVLAAATPTLGFVVALWVLALGFVLLGRWPSGDPPAWAAGEARPWPSAAETRAQRGSARPGSPAAAAAGAGADAPPEPIAPARSGSRKRKRKRGPNQRGR